MSYFGIEFKTYLKEHSRAFQDIPIVNEIYFLEHQLSLNLIQGRANRDDKVSSLVGKKR